MEQFKVLTEEAGKSIEGRNFSRGPAPEVLATAAPQLRALTQQRANVGNKLTKCVISSALQKRSFLMSLN
jgi:hypothetical protein